MAHLPGDPYVVRFWFGPVFLLGTELLPKKALQRSLKVGAEFQDEILATSENPLEQESID